MLNEAGRGAVAGEGLLLKHVVFGAAVGMFLEQGLCFGAELFCSRFIAGAGLLLEQDC